MLVPGVVSNLVAIPALNFVYLTWCPPKQSNGLITSYQLTYTPNNETLHAVNTTDNQFIISSLSPGTRVSGISATAFTSVGSGEISTVNDIATLSEPSKSNQTNTSYSLKSKTLLEIERIQKF